MRIDVGDLLVIAAGAALAYGAWRLFLLITAPKDENPTPADEKKQNPPWYDDWQDGTSASVTFNPYSPNVDAMKVRSGTTTTVYVDYITSPEYLRRIAQLSEAVATSSPTKGGGSWTAGQPRLNLE